jgi:predicted DNA-binding transcriptional regulator YafY
MRYQKAERLLKMISFLTQKQGLSAEQIAESFEVSVRTIYRDISSLSDIVPVYYDNGYRLLSAPTFPTTLFTPRELMLIKLGVGISALNTSTPFYRDIAKALDKIDQTMPIFKLREDEVLGEKIAVKVDMYANYAGKAASFNVLETAVRKRLRIRVRYFSLSGGKVETREIDPYSLLFRRHAWYLIGFCHLRGQLRTFRVERIRSLSLTGEHFIRPADFSLEEHLKNAWEIYTSGEVVEVKVLFDSRLAPLLLEGRRHPSQRIERLADGRVVFSAKVAGTEEIKHWVLRFGAQAEVLEPLSLRQEMAQEIERMGRSYRK